MAEQARRLESFSERDFYLAEFRGRSLAMALEAPGPGDLTAVESVLRDLDRNATRSVLLSHDRAALEPLCGDAIVAAQDPRWVAGVWLALRDGPRVGLQVGSGSLAAAARIAALRLRVAKLAWLRRRGALADRHGDRLSYVDLAHLDALLAAGPDSEPPELLGEIRAMVAGGLPSAAVCSFADLDRELFTYAGAGTFFTRDRYTEVRTLGLDEFDAAHDLVQRGVDEGYLVERTSAQLEEVLANAFGVFVERRYLAGIGALLPHEADGAGEIASLYTLTRFTGEGVGGYLVRHAVAQARERGWRYVFACTTSSRVESFFAAHGFARVAPTEIPAAKWEGYPARRQRLLHCLRRDL